MFFPSTPHSAFRKARLEELWVRYCQTGTKWGDAYPPPALMRQPYLSSQFSAGGNNTLIPSVAPSVTPALTPLAGKGKKRARSSSNADRESDNPRKRGRYDPIHVIDLHDIKAEERRRERRQASQSMPKPVRPIEVIDREVIVISDSD